jgi:Cu(I)/Ag(I) efflux system membrane protein CusA/SilA
MLETVVVLKPRSEWRPVPTWYSSWAPRWLKPALRTVTADTISPEQLVSELNDALRLPGLSNAWTMPIKARIDMLSTGIRTPVGLKISGDDLAKIEALGLKVEQELRLVPGTRSVFAERTAQGYFLDVAWDRRALARHGLSVQEAQDVLQTAVGGENVTTTVEGRARYPVNVRYQRDFRSDPAELARVLIPLPGAAAQVPLSQLATIRTVPGPSMIRNEDGLLTGYVYVDLAGRDPASYIAEARERLLGAVSLPAGYALVWSGQYESMQRVRERLWVVVPLTLLVILILLTLNTGSLVKTAIVVLAVPFSAVGAIWLLWLLGYNMSIGVWIGLIALLGVDAETGVFMLLYLEIAYEQAKKAGRLRSLAELREAIHEGAVKRLRPKVMTVATELGLLPVMLSTGTGADTMKRIAAPLIGGIFASFLLELLVYPAIYEVWKWHFELKPRMESPRSVR